MFRILIFFILILKTINGYSQGYDVFGLGIYDVKFDGSSSNYATDLRYERRFDNTIIDIGPEEDNFFYLKPFVGLEMTTDSAFYLISGIYLEDNLGDLMIGEQNNWNFTPSFGLGYYDDGNGKKLGNKLEFRTTLEVSYQLKNNDRIGFSFGNKSFLFLSVISMKQACLTFGDIKEWSDSQYLTM